MVCLAVNHPTLPTSFVVCELQWPSATCGCSPLCVTVWELCCAGGSPRSAPGRRRERQLVYCGPRRGTETRGHEGGGVSEGSRRE